MVVRVKCVLVPSLADVSKYSISCFFAISFFLLFHTPMNQTADKIGGGITFAVMAPARNVDFLRAGLAGILQALESPVRPRPREGPPW